MKIVLWITLGSLFFLAASISATASPTSKNCRFGCPLAANKLPHPPTFTPKSGNAAVLQRFVAGDWLYKVCYIYSASAAPNRKTSPGWALAGMVATRIRLPSSLLPQKTQEETHNGYVKANASNKSLPCLLPRTSTKSDDTGNEPQS